MKRFLNQMLCQKWRENKKWKEKGLKQWSVQLAFHTPVHSLCAQLDWPWAPEAAIRLLTSVNLPHRTSSHDLSLVVSNRISRDGSATCLTVSWSKRVAMHMEVNSKTSLMRSGSVHPVALWTPPAECQTEAASQHGLPLQTLRVSKASLSTWRVKPEMRATCPPFPRHWHTTNRQCCRFQLLSIS